ncbi:MAG TPA: uroporphyrinogen-III synthase [Acidimicrobiales bacterium]|nr:uroporphyrinogen-III synthase [Acidimicrobiales bacterium]
MPGATASLLGRTVAVTAERRADEQAELLRRRGADVLVVPTMHTVDLRDDDALRAATESVVAAPPDWLVATTGFGMRLWFEAADEWGLGEALVAALGGSRVVARGPKAQSACRQRGLDVVWRAPDESMAEVVRWLASQPGIGDESLVVQLFDPEDHPSTAELDAVARDVRAVPVYRWRMPDDLDAVRDLVRRIAERRVDAVTFTSQPAVRFLLDVALAEGLFDDVVDACNAGAVLPVCVGPVCAQPVEAAGIRTAVWPEPYRLVPMVRLLDRLLGTGFEVVDPRSEEAVTAMAAYFAELDARFPGGFDPGDALEADAERLEPPTGAFVLARHGGDVVGCGGVQTIGDGTGEIKRMWVAPSARGSGLGRRLLAELEDRCRALGHRTVRLDTNATLTEAIAMYERAGYLPVARYNDNPYADRFFEKPLA